MNCKIFPNQSQKPSIPFPFQAKRPDQLWSEFKMCLRCEGQSHYLLFLIAQMKCFDKELEDSHIKYNCVQAMLAQWITLR